MELLGGGVRWCCAGEGPRRWLSDGNVGGIQAGGASGKLPFEQGIFSPAVSTFNTQLSAVEASAGGDFSVSASAAINFGAC